jgi:hypothetical protein
MNKKFFNDVAPIIKNMQNWQAFIAIIDHQKEKLVKELETPQSSEDLIRANAKYMLLNHLTKLRDNVIDAEKNYGNSDSTGR